MKKVKIEHFDNEGNWAFIENWTLKTPLTGDYKKDKERLTDLVNKDKFVPKTRIISAIVVSWGSKYDHQSFLITVKK